MRLSPPYKYNLDPPLRSRTARLTGNWPWGQQAPVVALRSEEPHLDVEVRGQAQQGYRHGAPLRVALALDQVESLATSQTRIQLQLDKHSVSFTHTLSRIHYLVSLKFEAMAEARCAAATANMGEVAPGVDPIVGR